MVQVLEIQNDGERKRDYINVLPSAMGIELMLLGGMSPTSVTTAVIHVGGVKSYNGLNT